MGPYIGYGLSGKSKTEDTVNEETETEEVDVNWGSDDDIKRLDFGLTASVGMELNSMQIGLSFNLGLANISADTSFGQKVHKRVLGLSVAYKFGGK